MIGEIENPTKRPKTHYVTSAGTPGCQPPPFLKSPFLLSPLKDCLAFVYQREIGKHVDIDKVSLQLIKMSGRIGRL